jgi:hypothetical protein
VLVERLMRATAGMFDLDHVSGRSARFRSPAVVC